VNDNVHYMFSPACLIIGRNQRHEVVASRIACDPRVERLPGAHFASRIDWVLVEQGFQPQGYNEKLGGLATRAVVKRISRVWQICAKLAAPSSLLTGRTRSPTCAPPLLACRQSTQAKGDGTARGGKEAGPRFVWRSCGLIYLGWLDTAQLDAGVDDGSHNTLFLQVPGCLQVNCPPTSRSLDLDATRKV
jgi:hypothetical protein